MVKAWKEQVVLPTYEVGKPEKNPIFLEKRVYQGSSGVVYPYPVIESISNEKNDKVYDAIYLENEYIKVMILPVLGGRIQMAYDKIRQRHFVYYNSVVKPALVGLAGPWISGGIEFNWPQHHRPSTFMRVDADIENHEDGSVTVWVNEHERMFHQKGMAGITLRPGCAYLEIRGVLYNRTEVPQTFLWWANPAVKVNDHYQSVFPPDVNAVFDHGKRAVCTFPIATGEYYKMDYSAGVDISNYKNIKVPTSYMAVNSRFDFEGGYENDTRAGMLHVANHNVSTGKKQWTWGNGDFGYAWDRNLTDEDGPYIEIMAGVYAENQPDFSWLQPYEEKRFVQYFMPYRELGIVKNASKDLLLNIEPAGDGAVNLKVFATSSQKVRVVLKGDNGDIFLDKETVLSPEELLDERILVGDCRFEELTLELIKNGRPALSWHAEKDDVKPIPDPAKAALPPHEVKTCEQLYLTGLHLEQYRHATYNPTDYYLEALRRDPLDIRSNNAMGLWYIRKGRFADAEKYLRKAVDTLQERNQNPYDGEPIYNLGLALKYQYRFDEAYKRFYKSTWNGAWQDAGYFACSQISTIQGRWEDALCEVDSSLNRNWHNHKARALKAALLRYLNRDAEALALIGESLGFDRFNYGCLYERHLLEPQSGALDTMVSLMHDDANNYDELALDYCAAGLFKEAADIWSIAIGRGAVTPMTRYYRAWALQCMGSEEAEAEFEEAAKVSPEFCFPNRLEAVLALNAAMKFNPGDSHAPYFLGNLYYDKRQYDYAVKLWEDSNKLCDTFPTVKRNLALAYFNKLGRKDEALLLMEKAFSLDTTDSRIFMELDQLYKKMQQPYAERLSRFEEYPELVEQRDDLVLEKATLLNQLGKYEEARILLGNRTFHPWEGGEGKVPEQYQICRIGLADKAMARGDYSAAAQYMKECFEYPEYLGEGRLHCAQESDFYYYLGCAYDAMGDSKAAAEAWAAGVKAPTEPAAALYYNDAKPDKIFYSALCLEKLGRRDEARGRFHKLISYGEKHIFDDVVMDYFAVSLPDLLIWDSDLSEKNRIHCLYLLALGYWGIGEKEKSLKFLDEASAMDINHYGILSFKKMIVR